MKKPEEPPKLRCCCCKEFYRRGSFKCCAPPNGMGAGKWLQLACPMPPNGCGRCFRHCECEDRTERLGAGPLKELAEKAATELRLEGR